MDTEYTKGFKAGTAYEQERIIKLFHISEEPWTLEELIALIKREK